MYVRTLIPSDSVCYFCSNLLVQILMTVLGLGSVHASAWHQQRFIDWGNRYYLEKPEGDGDHDARSHWHAHPAVAAAIPSNVSEIVSPAAGGNRIEPL